MQISGDLGNHGHLVPLLRLTESRFDAAIHGFSVGANLMRAHLELGEPDEARRILELLFKQKRPDWREALQQWEHAILEKSHSLAGAPKIDATEMTTFAFDSPLWLPPESPLEPVFRRKEHAREEVPLICFLGSSAEEKQDPTHKGDKVVRQQSTFGGRLSRALPVYLAEQTEMKIEARARVLLPFIVKPDAGFMLAGKEFDNDFASHIARDGTEPAEYVVVMHVITDQEEVTIQLRLVRTIDHSTLANGERVFQVKSAKAAVDELLRELHESLVFHIGVSKCAASPFYQAPEAEWFNDYLLRLEQLMAVRCSIHEGASEHFLSGAREILEGNINLCLQFPENVTTRTLLLQTMDYMQKRKADIVSEYVEQLKRLQREKPVPAVAEPFVRRLAERVLNVS